MVTRGYNESDDFAPPDPWDEDRRGQVYTSKIVTTSDTTNSQTLLAIQAQKMRESMHDNRIYRDGCAYDGDGKKIVMAHESARFQNPSGYIDPVQAIENCLQSAEHRRELKKVLLRTTKMYQASSAGKNYKRSQRAGEWTTHLRRCLTESNLFDCVSPTGVSYRRSPKADVHFLVGELTDSENWMDAGLMTQAKVPGRESTLLTRVVGEIMDELQDEAADGDANSCIHKIEGQIQSMQHRIMDQNQLLREMKDLNSAAEKTLEKYEGEVG